VEKFEKEGFISWKNDSFYQFKRSLFASYSYWYDLSDPDWYIMRDDRFKKVTLDTVMEHLREIREDTRFKSPVTDSERFSCTSLKRILEY
jgi:hypothetical protein